MNQSFLTVKRPRLEMTICGQQQQPCARYLFTYLFIGSQMHFKDLWAQLYSGSQDSHIKPFYIRCFILIVLNATKKVCLTCHHKSNSAQTIINLLCNGNVCHCCVALLYHVTMPPPCVHFQNCSASYLVTGYSFALGPGKCYRLIN